MSNAIKSFLLFLLILTLVTVAYYASAQPRPLGKNDLSLSSPNKDSVIYDLGPVYLSLLEQQEKIKAEYENLEKSKQAFLIGFLSGKDRTVTDQDSISWIDNKRLRILNKRKKK